MAWLYPAPQASPETIAHSSGKYSSFNQSTLLGPIPVATSGNYKAYFDNYKRIVDYATNIKGIQVVVESWQAAPGGDTGGPMWRGQLVGSANVTVADFVDFWSKMAKVFAGNLKLDS